MVDDQLRDDCRHDIGRPRLRRAAVVGQRPVWREINTGKQGRALTDDHNRCDLIEQALPGHPIHHAMNTRDGAGYRRLPEEGNCRREGACSTDPIAGAWLRSYLLSPIVASMNSIVLASPFNAASRVASGVAPI